MPRGLGDDPLSRQRKSSRDKPAASDAPPLSPGTAPHEALSVQSFFREGQIPEASTSSQPSSYNDVFFQRRSEDSLKCAPAMNNGTPSPSVAEPVLQPTEIGRVSVGTATADSPRLQNGEDAAPSKTPPVLGETLVASGDDDAKTDQPRAEERGFFRRIFGRLGQQKNR